MTLMRGRISIVTGANAGIGKETALGLAKLGAHVVMVCRNHHRGAEAQAEIKKNSRNQKVDLVIADLSSQRSVRALADRLISTYPNLHVLINNAAVINQERKTTTDGIEIQFAVNHLAPFLLTNLLLDKFEQSAPARIVNVASQVHSSGHIDFENPQLVTGYTPLRAYYQSKLANVLFTYELARRLQDTGVTVNCLHPGVVATNLLCDYMARPRRLGFLNKLKHDTPTQGAKMSIYLASAPELEGQTGKYFHSGTGDSRSSPESYDEKVAQRLWELSEKLVHQDFH